MRGDAIDGDVDPDRRLVVLDPAPGGGGLRTQRVATAIAGAAVAALEHQQALVSVDRAQVQGAAHQGAAAAVRGRGDGVLHQLEHGFERALGGLLEAGGGAQAQGELGHGIHGRHVRLGRARAPGLRTGRTQDAWGGHARGGADIHKWLQSRGKQVARDLD